MGSVTVHLIRHEKTNANLKRQYIGWTDESILAKEKDFKLPIKAETVYGSDLKRCRETARLYFPETNFIPMKDLRELNFGDFEMKTYEELKDLSLYRNWIDNPHQFTPPNGERYEEFVHRVVLCFRKIISSNNQYIFVVHGGVIRALLAMFGSQEEAFQQIVVSHRTIYSLQWSDVSEVREGKRCKLLSVEPIMVKENL